MKKLLMFGLGLTLGFAVNAQTLEQRVEALEFAGYEDIFKFRGQVEMQYSTTTSKDNDNDTESTGQAWRMWSKLDMSAKPSDKMQFDGRLSVGKLFNRATTASKGTGLAEGLGEGQGETDQADSTVFLERFFVNYSITDKTTFTFGRLPTANGTPVHMLRNEAVGGSYPYMAYNAFFDGWAISQQVGDFAFRFVHTPFNWQEDRTTSSGGLKDTIVNGYAVIAEYEKLNLSWSRKFNVNLTYLSSEGLGINENNLDNAGNSTGQTDLEINIKRAVLAIEANGIMGSRFDLAFQTSQFAISSNNYYTVPDGVGGTTDLYFITDGGKEETATLHILTARYSINDKNKVVAQMAQGSQYLVTSDLVSRFPIETMVAGTSHHLAYNRVFDGGLSMNVGVMQNQIDYESPINDAFGERTDVDKQNSAVYTSFIANF